jgi:hypothetical protein
VRKNREQGAGDVQASRSLTIHIEELVLNGFPQLDRHRLGEAVQAELQRLFAERGVIPSAFGAAGAYPELAGGPMRIGQGATATTIGGQIARSVHEAVTAGLRGPGKSRRRR